GLGRGPGPRGAGGTASRARRGPAGLAARAPAGGLEAGGLAAGLATARSVPARASSVPPRAPAAAAARAGRIQPRETITGAPATTHRHKTDSGGGVLVAPEASTLR